MKKRTVIIVCVFILTLLGSATALAAGVIQDQLFLDFFSTSKVLRENDAVLVEVNGEQICVSEVDIEVEFSKLSYTLALSQIDNMDIEEGTKKQLINQQKESQKTRDEIVDDLIRETLLLQEAKRQGITVSFEEAKKFALEQYTVLKELAETSGSVVDQKNYEFILLYMQEMNLTEEQYIDTATEIYRKMLIISKLYDTQQKANATTVTEEGFSEDYLETLFQNAEIIYVK